jgi:hypothetical protein
MRGTGNVEGAGIETDEGHNLHGILRGTGIGIVRETLTPLTMQVAPIDPPNHLPNVKEKETDIMTGDMIEIETEMAVVISTGPLLPFLRNHHHAPVLVLVPALQSNHIPTHTHALRPCPPHIVIEATGFPLVSRHRRTTTPSRSTNQIFMVKNLTVISRRGVATTPIGVQVQFHLLLTTVARTGPRMRDIIVRTATVGLLLYQIGPESRMIVIGVISTGGHAVKMEELAGVHVGVVGATSLHK